MLCAATHLHVDLGASSWVGAAAGWLLPGGTGQASPWWILELTADRCSVCEREAAGRGSASSCLRNGPQGSGQPRAITQPPPRTVDSLSCSILRRLLLVLSCCKQLSSGRGYVMSSSSRIASRLLTWLLRLPLLQLRVHLRRPRFANTAVSLEPGSGRGAVPGLSQCKGNGSRSRPPQRRPCGAGSLIGPRNCKENIPRGQLVGTACTEATRQVAVH